MDFLSWFKSRPRRRGSQARDDERSEIFVYYWNGGAPVRRELKDFSLAGGYLCTPDRWCIGTIITATLERDSASGETTAGKGWISVQCRIAAHGGDGVRVTFMLLKREDQEALTRFLRGGVLNGVAPSGTAPKATASNGTAPNGRAGPLVYKVRVRDGQALIECALMIPLLFLLIVLAVNFGGFIYDWIAVANAARAAADYEVLGGASWDYPAGATSANIQTLVTSDTSTLPNASASNPSVKVCTNNTTADLPVSAACPSGLKADPEAPLYVSMSIDVTYTYTPFIPVFSFPSLGIGLPTMASTIRRHTVMRMLQ